MSGISVKNLSRSFVHRKKEVFALRNISFEVKEGEIFGLLGPNGAGKTTLINILTGILTPTSGNAYVFGYDVNKDHFKIVRVINSASGETLFHWVLSVRQILNFFGRVYGLSRSQTEKKINYLANRFKIKNIMNHKYAWLSSGQRMRVALVKSLLNDPKLLLLDEPTLGLDPDIAKKTRELILEINKEFGTTILLTSHYMAEVEQLCSRIAFIDKGKIVDVGEIDKIKSLRFASFKIFIKLEVMERKKLLRKLGFKITEDGIVKTVNREQEISPILNSLVKNKFRIADIKIQRPTLEDYFLKMVGKK